MAGSVYNLRPADFRAALAAGRIGLCPKCMTHDEGHLCQCKTRLIDQAGHLIPLPPRRQVHPAPPQEKQKPQGPYRDGTGPECSAMHPDGPCSHYRVINLEGHCAQARWFDPRSCRALNFNRIDSNNNQGKTT